MIWIENFEVRLDLWGAALREFLTATAFATSAALNVAVHRQCFTGRFLASRDSLALSAHGGAQRISRCDESRAWRGCGRKIQAETPLTWVRVPEARTNAKANGRP